MPRWIWSAAITALVCARDFSLPSFLLYLFIRILGKQQLFLLSHVFIYINIIRAHRYVFYPVSCNQLHHFLCGSHCPRVSPWELLPVNTCVLQHAPVSFFKTTLLPGTIDITCLSCTAPSLQYRNLPFLHGSLVPS